MCYINFTAITCRAGLNTTAQLFGNWTLSGIWFILYYNTFLFFANTFFYSLRLPKLNILKTSIIKNWMDEVENQKVDGLHMMLHIELAPQGVL